MKFKTFTIKSRRNTEFLFESTSVSTFLNKAKIYKDIQKSYYHYTSELEHDTKDDFIYWYTSKPRVDIRNFKLLGHPATAARSLSYCVNKKETKQMFKKTNVKEQVNDRREMISSFYDGHRDFIAMTNTNMYDGIYFAIHWLNTYGYSGFSHEIKADAKFTDTEGRKKIMKDLRSMGYTIRSLNGYFEAIKFDQTGMFDSAVYLVFHANEFIVINRDNEDIPEDLDKLIEPYRNRNVVVYEYNRPGDNIDSETKELRYDDTKDFHKEFYPWMQEDFDDFIKGFLESSSNALILIGPPGTGKTSWLKQFILRQDNPAMYSANTEVISSGLLFSEFSSSDAKVLIMEDADSLTMRRTDGNTTMSQLLNSLSGITSEKDKKIIISTNLPNLDKVDPALIRPGRCYRTLYFSLLSKEEANEARRAIGLEPINFNKEKVTLAECLNYTDEEDIQARSQGSMGFV